MAWLLDNHLRFFRALHNLVLVEENSIKPGVNTLAALALCEPGVAAQHPYRLPQRGAAGLPAAAGAARRVEDPPLRQACLNPVHENLVPWAGFRTPAGCFVRGGGDSPGREVRIDYIQHTISAFLHYHLGGH